MDKKIGVYKIECFKNHKIYVGASTNLAGRKRQHFSDLRLHKHANPRLQKDFDLFGEREFVFLILEVHVPVGKLLEREQHWIDLLKPEYNAELKAGFSVAHNSDPEVRSKISATMKEVWQDPEYKQNFINKRKGVPLPKLKGRVFSEETKQKIRESGSGEKNHNYGKPRCQSFLDKMRNEYPGAISPDGVVYSPIVGLKKFCEEHGLDSGQMSRVLNGTAKTHKGWTKV
jgi:group I intron endonuclease